MTKQPNFDSQGYPTDETLEAISQWPHGDVSGCLDFVKAAWFYPGHATHELKNSEKEVVWARETDRYLRLSTGGWSGNECLVSAMKENVMLMWLTWQLDARGGLLIFRYPAKHVPDVEEIAMKRSEP